MWYKFRNLFTTSSENIIIAASYNFGWIRSRNSMISFGQATWPFLVARDWTVDAQKIVHMIENSYCAMHDY